MISTWVIYPLLTTALFYLGSQAAITRAIWSKYPKWLDRFMSCAACLGFWLGLAVAMLGWWRDWPFLRLPGRDWLTVLIVGFGAMIWTPLLAYQHLAALTALQGDTRPPPPSK